MDAIPQDELTKCTEELKKANEQIAEFTKKIEGLKKCAAEHLSEPTQPDASNYDQSTTASVNDSNASTNGAEPSNVGTTQGGSARVIAQCCVVGGARRRGGAAESANTISTLVDALSKLGKTVDPGDSIHDTAHKLYIALKSFDVKQKDYSKICESARVAINKIMGAEVIKPSSDPVQLINNINDHLRALKEKHCGDFDVIKKDVETSIDNLHVLMEMIQNAYDHAIANTTTDRSIMEATRPVLDHIRTEANRQISLLSEFLKVPVRSVEATVTSMRSETPPEIIKQISKGSMSDRLSSILVGLGETGLLKARMETALTTLGLKMGENSKSIGEAFLDKLEALKLSGSLTDASIHKISDAYKILEPMTDGNVIRMAVGGFTITGAAPHVHPRALPQSKQPHHPSHPPHNRVGGVTGGKQLKSMNKQIRQKSTDYSSAMHAFRAAMNIYYDKLTFTVDQLAMATLRESPKITDDLEKFKNAIDKLDHLQSQVVFQSLSGLHEDSDSIAVRDRFINYMRIVAERAYILKGISDLYNDIGNIITDMITRIGQYSVIRPFKGGADLQSDALIIGAAEIAQKTGGKELFVVDLPQDRTRAWKLADAIRKYIYYVNMQRIHKSMDFAESDIAQYNEDYANLVGEAVGKVLNEAQSDLKRVLKIIDDLDEDELDQLITSPKSDAAKYKSERAGIKDAVKKYHRRKYKKLVRTYKFAQRIDALLLAFTDSAIKNRNLLENVFASLESTNYIANWMSEDSGDAMVHAFENFPPAESGELLPPPQHSAASTIQTKARYRESADDKFPDIQKHYYEVLYQGAIKGQMRPLGDASRPVAFADVGSVMDAFKKAKQKTKAGKNLIQLFFKIGNTISPEKSGGFSAESERQLHILGGFEDYGEEEEGPPVAGGGKADIPPAHRDQELTKLKLGAVVWRTIHLRRNIDEHDRHDTYTSTKDKADHEKTYKIDEITDLAITLRTYTMNAIAGKIFAAIGLYNRTHDHTKNHGAADVITQTIFGRGQSVEVLPEVADLYLRLPLLAEFYREVLGFDDKDGYSVKMSSIITNIKDDDTLPYNDRPKRPVELKEHKITMVPDIDGMYSGLIKVIFSRLAHNESSPYSDNQIRELVTCINTIYAKYKADNSSDPVGDAFRGLVREINRRIMIIKWSDVERYQKHKREYLNERVDKKSDSADYDTDFPKVNKKHSIVPSDKFVDFSKVVKDQVSIQDKMKIFKEFRTRLMRRLGGVDPSHYSSFNSLLLEFRNKMGMAKDNAGRFNEVLALMGGLDRGANTDVIKLMMFRECVVAPIEVMKFIYGQCRKFIDTVSLLDISKIENFTNGDSVHETYINDLLLHHEHGSRYTTGPGNAKLVVENMFYDLVNAIYQFGGDSRETVNISIEEGRRESCRLVIQFGKLQDAVASTIRGIDACITAFSEQIPHSLITKYVGSTTSAGSLTFLRRFLLDEMLLDNYPREEDGKIHSIADAVTRINSIFAKFAKPWGEHYDNKKPKLGDAFKKLMYSYDNQGNMSARQYAAEDFADAMQISHIGGLAYYGYPKEYAGRFTGVIYNCNQIISYLLDSVGDNKPYTGLMSALADNAVYAKKALGNLFLKPDGIYYGNSDEIVFASNAARIHEYLRVTDTGKYAKSEADLSKLGAYVKDTLTTTLPVVWRMSAELNKKCDLIKDLVRYGHFDLSGAEYKGYQISRKDVQSIEREVNRIVFEDINDNTLPIKIKVKPTDMPKIRQMMLAIGIVARTFDKKLFIDNSKVQYHAFHEYFNSIFHGDTVGINTKTGVDIDDGAGAADANGIDLLSAEKYKEVLEAARSLYNLLKEHDGDIDKLYEYSLYDRDDKDWAEQTTKHSTENEKYIIGQLNSTADVLYRISTACSETLTALSDNMLFGEHKANFMANYRSSTSKIPVSPLSWVLCGLRKVDSAGHKTYLLPNESPTSEEYKYNRALRPLISPGISITLDRCPYNESLFVDYDIATDKVNKIDKSQYADLMMGMATLSQYALFQKVYRSIFNSKPVQYAMYNDTHLLDSDKVAAWFSKSQYLGVLKKDDVCIDKESHDYKMYHDWQLYKHAVSHMPPPAEDLFDYAENHNQQKSLYYLTKYKSQANMPDRSKLRVYNILDMGVAPINLNVLRREIPFVNIYNYHLGFVDMMHEFLDIGKSAHYDLELANTRLSTSAPAPPQTRVTSIRYNDVKLPHRLLYKLIQDPYAEISTDEYNHLGLFMKGNTDLPRPMYLSDQLWNKCLLNRINDIRIPVEASGATMTRYPAATDPASAAGDLPLPTNLMTLSRVVIPTPAQDNIHTYVNNHVLPQELRENLRPLYMTYMTDDAYTGGDESEQIEIHDYRKTRTCGLMFLKPGFAYTEETLENFGGDASTSSTVMCVNSQVLQTVGSRAMVSSFAEVGKSRFDLLILRRMFHKVLLHYFVLQKLARELFSSVSPVVRGMKMIAPARLGYATPYDAWRDNDAQSSVLRERRHIADNTDESGRYDIGQRNASMR